MSLHLVEGSQPPKKKAGRPMSVTRAAKSGNKVLLLETLRDRLAKQVQDPDCPPRDLASLSKRLLEVCDELDKARAAKAKEADELDEDAEDEAWDGNI